MTTSTRQQGNRGEDLAADFLAAKGLRIVCRNYRFERGEIDIVAEDGNELVFVEVKLRRTDRFGAPEEAVTPQKQERIRKVAEGYLFEHGLEEKWCRYDVVAVDVTGRDPEIRHLEHAF